MNNHNSLQTNIVYYTRAIIVLFFIFYSKELIFNLLGHEKLKKFFYSDERR